ncbi:MAG: hypothetical protein ACKOLA_14675 [Spartobacteria bacterium]
MLIQSLEHLAQSALALAQSRKIYVLGSSSILASFPELGEAGLLDNTFDADFLIDPVNKGVFELLKEAIGEGSLFEKEKGYYADILHPSIVETLPPGWDARLVGVSGFENVFALQPLDLAAVKIVVGREKDLALVRRLLELGKIRAEDLRARWSSMALGERELFRSGRNFAEVTKGFRGE